MILVNTENLFFLSQFANGRDASLTPEEYRSRLDDDGDNDNAP